MIDVILWLFILLPALMFLEAKRSIRHYILSGKIFFAPSHERALSSRTIAFLMVWMFSLPVSFVSLIIIIVRWS